MYTYHEATTTALHSRMCRSIAFGPADDDTAISVFQHNVLAVADSFQWDLDLKRLWLTKQRWTSLVHQYLNKGAVDYWLDSISSGLVVKKNARGLATLRTNNVSPRRSGSNGTTRRWGSCILAVTYRQHPVPQITLHSRTSYLGYIAALDLSLAHCLAIEVGKRTGLTPSDMRFCWQLEAAQFHPMRSIAYFLGSPTHRANLWGMPHDRSLEPSLYHSRKWFDRIERQDAAGTPYSKEKFSSFTRIRKRYHTEVIGDDYGEQFADSKIKTFTPLPSLRTGALSLHFNRHHSAVPARLDHVELDYTTDPEEDDSCGIHH